VPAHGPLHTVPIKCRGQGRGPFLAQTRRSQIQSSAIRGVWHRVTSTRLIYVSTRYRRQPRLRPDSRMPSVASRSVAARGRERNAGRRIGLHRLERL
jgi:hypothetical protein